MRIFLALHSMPWLRPPSTFCRNNDPSVYWLDLIKVSLLIQHTLKKIALKSKDNLLLATWNSEMIADPMLLDLHVTCCGYRSSLKTFS